MVKIFKLLINELYHLKESNLINDEESDYNSDDDDGRGDVDEAGNAIGENGTSTTAKSGQESCLRVSQLWFDDDEEEDDQLLQELLQDSIFQTSMDENLTKFLQNFTQAEQFAEYAGHLNESEKNILRGIQVNV